MHRENKYSLGVIVFLGAVFLTVLPTALHAQDSRQKAQGYIFAGPGALVCCGSSSSALHFGGGGEGFIHRGFAAGAELGYLAPAKDLASGIGVLSVNPAYHFARRDSNVVPFATGGYSLGFRQGAIGMANFGGGVTWWASPRHCMRFEFRDHYSRSEQTHFPIFRVAWTFH